MSRLNDPFEHDRDGLRQVEEMVRAARDYVSPSDDLRPRLLESVRVGRRSEGQRRLLISVVAPALVLVVALTNHLLDVRQTLNEASTRRQVARTMSSLQSNLGEQVNRQYWGLADAFFLVKQQHAEALAGVAGASSSDESIDSDRFDARAGVSDPSE